MDPLQTVSLMLLTSTLFCLSIVHAAQQFFSAGKPPSWRQWTSVWSTQFGGSLLFFSFSWWHICSLFLSTVVFPSAPYVTHCFRFSPSSRSAAIDKLSNHHHIGSTGQGGQSYRKAWWVFCVFWSHSLSSSDLFHENMFLKLFRT